MRYRKRTLKVSSLTDPLHLKSKLAIMVMARAVLSMKSGKVDEAMEAKAVQLLLDEQSTRNPGDRVSIQMDRNTGMSDPMQGQY